MAEEDDVQQFPDVKDKLAAPKKLSQFEKDRQIAEAKRRKEEEENAAALREFEDSFADDNDEDDMVSRTMGGRGGRAPPSGPRGGPGGFNGGGGRFGAPRSGPGSLPGPGMPPSLKRKRELEEAREAAEARRAELGYDYVDDYQEGMSPAAAREDSREDNTPKPTVQLSSIPPGTSEQEIKTLLAGTVKVHHVRLSSSTGQGKKSLTAIATLDSSTSAAQIDKTVSALRDRYMGCGFYLSISRHLSSAAQFQGVGATGGSASSEPFGAQKSRNSNPKHSMRNAPPPQDHRGFAPPEYYDQRGPPTRSASAQVEVHPPLDIATVRAIHTVSDKILAQKDANRALEMEALLMTLPEVQKDERFAFLYDSKSPAGVYYRFCLWAPDSIDEQKRNAKGPERIFKDLDMDWLPPQKETPFLDLTSLAQATDHVDYDTSDDEADDDGDERKLNKGPAGEPDARMGEKSRLSPLQRARFTRLLSRLPTSIARLRQGDISRISNYVVNHAGGGAEEFVDLLLLNVEKPFSSTLAAKYDTDSGSDSEQDTRNSNGRTAATGDEVEEDDYEPGDALLSLPADSANAPNTTEDPSNPKLIALYTISDILSASSTAGARNAWKYRTLFEAGLSHQKTFQNLGRLDKELGWGRLKSEQWKRKVGVVLSVWESWSVFTGGVLEGLKKDFYEPPLTEAEVAAAAAEAKQEEAKKSEEEAAGWKSKFKKVESASASPAPSPAPGASNADAIDTAADPVQAPTRFKPVGGLDGTSDLSSQTAPPAKTAPASSGGLSLKGGFKGPAAPKRRMRAEDMFGDSDED
ncbi:hypothetical protein MBLNU13_g07425t1 [Cladosporium sp. NU13]